MHLFRRRFQWLTAIAVTIATLSFSVHADEVRKFTLGAPDNPILFGWAAAVEGDQALISDTGVPFQAGAAYLMDVNDGQVLRKLTSSVARTNDFFGFDVDISGNLAAVGAPANPNARNPLPGAVNIFDLSTGAELSRLLPSDSIGGDEFGFATALDSSMLAVGAPALGEMPGRAYLFDASSGNELFKLQPTDPFVGNEFGWDLDVSGDYAVVGAPVTYDDDDPQVLPGAAYVFDTSTGQQVKKLQPMEMEPGNEFGFSIGVSGNRAVIGSPESAASFKGAAYVFDLTTGEQLRKLQPSDSRVDDDFGSAVDIYGNVAAVGARGKGSVPGAVYLFDLTTGQELAKLTPSDLANKDKFGSAIALSGNRLVAGAPNDVDPVQNLITGSAYLFDVETGVLGDFNHDGLLTAIDIDMLTTEVRSGANGPDFDLNSDGQVDRADREQWVEQIANTYFGDSNFDGVFDSGDLVTIFVAAEYEDGIANNSTWAEGDWDGDGDFGSGDLVFVFQRNEYETGPRAGQAVPEPSGIALLAAAAGAFGLCRRRRA